MYRLIFKNADISTVDLSSVECVVVSGEPSSAELIQQISQAFFDKRTPEFKGD